MNYIAKIFSIIIIISFLGACTERIDINTNDAETRLSVFGYITNKIGRHSIKITYTAGFFSNEPPQGISNAKVIISDGENEYTLTENKDSLGLYQTDSLFYGIEGKTYRLDISLDFDMDGNDEKYYATAYMPLATRVDSVVLAPSIKMPRIPNLKLYGKVPDSQANYLAIYLRKNSQPQNIFDFFMILTDSYFIGYDITGYDFPCMITDGIELNDTVIFKVNCFSEEFAQFISNASSEVGGSIPIFGGPPADVITNIYASDDDNETQIVGFFGAFPWNEKNTISQKDYTGN